MASKTISLKLFDRQQSLSDVARNYKRSVPPAPLVIGSVVAMLLGVLPINQTALAQSIPGINAQTMTPIPGVGHDYLKILDDTVDPSSGSLSLKINIPLPPGRGLNIPLSLNYNSNGSVVLIDSNGTGPTWFAVPFGGWSTSLPTLSANEYDESEEFGSGGPCPVFYGYVFKDPTGERYGFANLADVEFEQGSNGCAAPDPNIPFLSTDVIDRYQASFIRNQPDSGAGETVYVMDQSGTTYYFGGLLTGPNWPSSIEDRNGNIITFSGTSTADSYGSNFSLTDTIGRTLANLSQWGANGATISVSGVDRPYVLSWENIKGSGYSNNVTQLPSSTSCGSMSGNEAASGSAIENISLPDGLSYSFLYDPAYGLLKQVTYPTGAVVAYTWANNSQSAGEYAVFTVEGSDTLICEARYDTPAVAKRTVSVPDASGTLQEVEEEDFSYSTTWGDPNVVWNWTSKQTTVTTHDLVRNTTFVTTYTYAPAYFPAVVNSPSYQDNEAPVEQQIVYKDTNGSILRTVDKTWNDPYTMTSESTQFPNVGTSEVTYKYGDLDQVVEKDEYDFGQSTPTRITATSYQSFVSPINPASQTFISPSSSIVCTGAAGVGNCNSSSSARMAATDFYYDQGALAASGVSSLWHDNSPIWSSAARANVTTVDKRCFTSGCPGDSITTATYDDAGQIVSITDPCGNGTCADVTGQQHTTHYYYTDSYASGSPSGTTDSFVTSITDPLGHQSSYSWNYATGELASATDLNGNMTRYCYLTGGCEGSTNDPWNRPTEVDFPDGGSTVTSYSDQGPEPYSTTTKAISGTTVESTTTTLDGLGRVIRTLINSDPSGAVRVDTQYDGEGNVWTKSNSYRPTVPSSSDGTSTYYYDALKRPTVQMNPDGTSLQWCYDNLSNGQSNCHGHIGGNTGEWVDRADESGSDWQQTTDGLGRLLSVYEPSGTVASGTVQPPSLATNYDYDVLDDLISITQIGNGSTDTPRSRAFSYDSLSRLITSQDPETGTICYGQSNDGSCSGGYDANGNLQYKTDANGVTSSYTYDALNRPIQETFSDGSPSRVYGYDGKDNLGDQLPSLYEANAIGRLSFASDNNGTEMGFGYDRMGRVATQGYCFAGGSCDGSVFTSASYDLAGDLVSLSHPDGLVVNQSWDGAERLSTVTDGTPGGSGTAYFSAPSESIEYWPSGALMNVSYGNGVTQLLSINSRLQPCQSTANWAVPALSANTSLLDRQSFYSTSPPGTCGNEPNNNGNVYSITDNLQPGLTESFSYDSLNRVTNGIRSDAAYNHTYSYDSFGNMTVTDNLAPNSAVVYSIDPATNRLLRSHDGGVTWGDYQYDAGGTLIQSADGISSPHTYQHNALDQIISIDSGTTASYVYDSDNERVSKQTANETTHYFYFAGQPIAEQNPDGSWSDYIYANGQKIAKVDSEKPVFVFKGTRSQSDESCDLNAVFTGNGLIAVAQAVGAFQPGDILSVDMRIPESDTGIYAHGGIMVYASGNTVFLNDQEGNSEIDDTVSDGKWHHRSFAVGNALAGQTPMGLEINDLQDTPVGDWEIDYANFTLTRANGSIITIPVPSIDLQVDNESLSSSPISVCGSSNLTASAVTMPVDPTEGTTYFVDDHLGSMQMELSNGGWPIWEGQFTPFGQEIVGGQIINTTLGPQNPDGTSMHYKFTGKERDAESGLDYFGARYYASTSGRFTSPDWSEKEEPVPYAKLDNPQSLNLYSYVLNNPLSQADPDGHCGEHLAAERSTAAVGMVIDCLKATQSAGHQGKAGSAQQQQSDGIAGQINHETMGMKDSKTENEPLASAENKIAHVRLNGIKKWGSNEKAQKYASMVSAIENGPGFKISQQAVEQAIREDSKGIDPTSGAIYYNMRTESQFKHGGTFQGQAVHTASGPFISPSKYTYIMTYGPPPQ